jgi:hypothetical protein
MHDDLKELIDLYTNLIEVKTQCDWDSCGSPIEPTRELVVEFRSFLFTWIDKHYKDVKRE